MRVLITGGTGFIGRALCRVLLGQGQEVSVLTRDAPAARRSLPAPVLLVSDLAALSTTPDAVVNLAGENLGKRRWTQRAKHEFMHSRLAVTRTLVEWIRALSKKPRVLVSGSAVGYYGARGDTPLSEEAPPAVEFQSELCRTWETEAQRAESLGVRVCRIRTGIVLGPDGGALKPMLLPFKLGFGGHLGDGRQWMSWIHRADLIALILWLVGRDACAGAYNATAPHPVTNREFARALGAAVHRPAILPMPGWALKPLVGEMAHLLLTGQNVVPTRALAEGFTFRFPDLRPAFDDVLSR
jgi:uncharacterized protein (TIGR01777 family)